MILHEHYKTGANEQQLNKRKLYPVIYPGKLDLLINKVDTF